MSEINEIISEMFAKNWCGAAANDLELARKQLHKNLKDQTNGYWSGHSAYQIMTKGGFLVDEKHVNGKAKKLTALGKKFMSSYEANA